MDHVVGHLRSATNRDVNTAAPQIPSEALEVFIEPITPNLDASFHGGSSAKRKFKVYIAIQELSSFAAGLDLCRDSCHEVIYQQCLQFDGSRHITMFK